MNNIIPLKIPSGWAILNNNCFNDAEMIVVNGSIQNDASFKEDILSISQIAYVDEKYKVLENGYWLDLGWYPDSNPSGSYKLVLFRDNWNNKMIEFKSKNKVEIQAAINNLLYLFSNIKIADELNVIHTFEKMSLK
jgi:hypothetical protein